VKDLKGRVAVVTGGAGGIGNALVKAFLKEGMKVVIGDVEEPVLDAAVKELAAAGGDVRGVVTDVSSPESVGALADAVFSAHGACHLLCNNAGVSVPSVNIWETTPNDWKWVHGVNVNGVVHGIQAFVPRMIKGGEQGFVMNTSSGDGGIAPLAEQSVYASSKAAVSILTECLASQLVSQQTKLRAGIFYPSGGLLRTGIWTTKRNRPDRFARERPAPDGSQPTFEEFSEMIKGLGIELPVQDLDELARSAVEGIRSGDFVIMIGREGMKAQLTERAQALANGKIPAGAMGL
jgi:NAD(P)-dependent dehydrogenase (short-subunit alcohol dehydrogenase family)